MPTKRSSGMDHDHYDWSPIVKRGVLNWPDNARVALCVIINLEHMEWQPPEGSVTTRLSGGLGDRRFPDYPRMSHREYGHRVGIFRVLDALDKHGVKATIAMDALTAENYPYLVNHCLQRGCEIIGHGISASRIISSKMSETEEQAYIQTSLATLKRATGSAPIGWLGSEYGESTRTPQLLAKAGIRYVCDWTNDEQPYRMSVPKGTLFSLPTMNELDDVYAHWNRHVSLARWVRMVTEAFDVMHEDGAQQGRLLAWTIHPWLVGQPFRIGYLAEALEHMTQRGAWTATGKEIIDWYSQRA